MDRRRHGGRKGERWPRERGVPLSRRSLVAGLAGLAFGGSAGRSSAAAQATPAVATPAVAVEGFDDPARWQGRVIRAGGFGGEVQAALSATVFQPFAAATGCEVREVVTDYDTLAGTPPEGEPYADVLVVDMIWLAGEGRADAVEPLPEALTGQPWLIDPFPGGAVPAYAYAMVSAFRRDAVERIGAPEDWAAWWNGERYTGRRALPNGPLGTLECALLADGVAPDALYPLDLDRAFASLDRVRPLVSDRWWEEGAQPVLWLSRGRTEFAAAWHHRVVAGQRDGRAVDFTWDQGLLAVDYWIAPKATPQIDVAADLIRFATSPGIQAALAAAVPMGPVRAGGLDAVDARTVTVLPTSEEALPRLVALDGAWWAEHRDEAADRFATWLAGAETDA